MYLFIRISLKSDSNNKSSTQPLTAAMAKESIVKLENIITSAEKTNLSVLSSKYSENSWQFKIEAKEEPTHSISDFFQNPFGTNTNNTTDIKKIVDRIQRSLNFHSNSSYLITEFRLEKDQNSDSLATQLTESKEQRPKTISLEALESLVKKYNQPLLSGGYDEYLLDKKRYLEQENQKLPSYTK